MNLDQQRKLLIQTLNYRWRDPSLSDKIREEILSQLKEIVNKLPGAPIVLEK